MAVSYLLAHGYRIIKRNYSTRYGEIDIICLQDKILVFVEVRTKSSRSYGLPEESITREKIEHLRKAALAFLGSQCISYEEIRFDVIGILLSGETTRINHIPEAF